MKKGIVGRDRYLRALVARKHNGFVKIITGMRRVGKSTLLFSLFKRHLVDSGVPSSRIIEVALDEKRFQTLKDPLKLHEYLIGRISGNGRHYVFIDEIQESLKVLQPGIDLARVAPEDRENAFVTVYHVLSEMMKDKRLDIYVTGSNSRLLSKDVATLFRDRGDEVRVHPYSFGEFLSTCDMERADAWESYLRWGGMPEALKRNDEQSRRDYLEGLFAKTYFKDILERNKLKDRRLLSVLTDTLMSSVGGLTNATKLADTITTELHVKTNQPSVSKYLDAIEDSFLIDRAVRYDVKGRRYLSTPLKYYAEDLGLRNVRLGFRQVEHSHLMENAIFNELRSRGLAVDVGVVELVTKEGGKSIRKQTEIDFVVNGVNGRVYIQSAYAIPDEAKRKQETFSLRKSGDFFSKLVVTSGAERLWTDEAGISYVGVIPFLLDESILDGLMRKSHSQIVR